MMRMIMRSGTAVNILMQKRVRFICVHGIMIRRLDGLFHEILLPVRKLIHSVLIFILIVIIVQLLVLIQVDMYYL